MGTKGHKNYPKNTVCSVPECGRPVKAKELCNPHYQRQRLGMEFKEKLRPKEWKTPQEVLDFYTIKTEHGLLWAGEINKGYGRACYNNKTHRAHRLAWEAAHGPIPEGIEIDHDPSCPKTCVTVEHLTPMTRTEHNKIGWQRGELTGGWGEESRKRRRKDHICPVCNLEFEADTKAVYCSNRCKRRYYRQLKKPVV